jgi:hypothetical protein
MKKIILICCCFLFSFLTVSTVQAQSKGGFGIKGGLNYNSNGKFRDDVKTAYGDPLNSLGYNVGLFGKINLGPFFVRPELVFAQMNNEINSVNFVTKRFDAPVLVGMNLFGPLVSIFAGPAMHYRITDDLLITDYKKFNAGYQFGAGINIGIIGVDLRYERELSGNTLNVDNILKGKDDFKLQQVTFNLSVKF